MLLKEAVDRLTGPDRIAVLVVVLGQFNILANSEGLKGLVGFGKDLARTLDAEEITGSGNNQSGLRSPDLEKVGVVQSLRDAAVEVLLPSCGPIDANSRSKPQM